MALVASCHRHPVGPPFSDVWMSVSRAHLPEMAGDSSAAREAYRTAARLTTSLAELRYLEARADGPAVSERA
jgi:predicted RNA polymerase sigma factor